MVNLISETLRSRLQWLYYSRLVTVVFTVLGLALLATALLMLPTYFFIHAEADQAEGYVRSAGDIATQRAKGQSQETLATFHEAVKLLTVSARDPAFQHIVSLITTDLPRGVSLSGVHLVYDTAGNAALKLDGMARTRAELIAYSAVLKKIPELTNVSVPVSDLVADIDSTFSVTATWVRPQKP